VQQFWCTEGSSSSIQCDSGTECGGVVCSCLWVAGSFAPLLTQSGTVSHCAGGSGGGGSLLQLLASFAPLLALESHSTVDYCADDFWEWGFILGFGGGGHIYTCRGTNVAWTGWNPMHLGGSIGHGVPTRETAGAPRWLLLTGYQSHPLIGAGPADCNQVGCCIGLVKADCAQNHVVEPCVARRNQRALSGPLFGTVRHACCLQWDSPVT
jgi:hypothetical protein